MFGTKQNDLKLTWLYFAGTHNISSTSREGNFMNWYLLFSTLLFNFLGSEDQPSAFKKLTISSYCSLDNNGELLFKLELINVMNLSFISSNLSIRCSMKVFYEIGVLKNFAKFHKIHRKTPVPESRF